MQNSNGWFDESQRMPQSSLAMKWLGILLVALAPELYAQTGETNASAGPAAISSDVASAPKVSTGSSLNFRPMSLQDCIQIALEHNFDIQIARYEPRIAAFTLYGAYGAYEPVLSLSGEHDYNLTPGGFDPQ